MQFILSLLALAASATAAPTATTPTCSPGTSLSCCQSITSNGTGIGCILSTLNPLGIVCLAGSSAACCNTAQEGLINVGCVPIAISL